jgi:DNA (cytosine-5)-methyltransferase 1
VKPRLLDLFCGAGGCSAGYARAGFDVVGVDVKPQPNYPYEFVQADALEVLDRLSFGLSLVEGDLACHVEDFAAIHASPPCQHFTKYGNVVKDIRERYEDLIEPVRELLKATGLPYVIENVEGSPLHDSIVLCGSMFDLDVQRHRLFETNWPLVPPTWPCRHKIWSRRFKSSTGRKPNSRFTIEVGSWDEKIERQKAAMGVDWTIATRELSEAIPPAYTEFIGQQLLAHPRLEAAA